MKSFFKRLNYLTIITATILMVIGVLFCAMQHDGGTIVCYVFGGALIVLGIVYVIYACAVGLTKTKYEFPMGCLLTVLGIVFIAKNADVVTILPLIFGLFVVADGFSRLKDSIVLANRKWKYWWIFLIICFVFLSFGFLSMFLEIEKSYILMGVFAIICSVTDIVVAICFNKKLADIKETKQNIVDSINTVNDAKIDE